MVTASICTIGDEILIGQIVDTNSSAISKALGDCGVRCTRMISIGDDHYEIISNLRNELRHNDIVVVTGGLGPTKDDITKAALAEISGSKGYVENNGQLDVIYNILHSRGLDVLDINKAQALVPDKCEVIVNKLGTAPVMVFRLNMDGHCSTLYSLPGVPFEALGALPEVILDIKSHNKLESIFHRTLMTYGIAESALARKIEDWEDSLPSNIHLAYLPNPCTGVRLRLSIYGGDREEQKIELANQIDTLSKIIGEYIYSYEDDTIESVIAEMLLKNHKTLSCAESCTGGRISALMVSMAGSSEYYLGSVTSYANSVKQNVLNVPKEIIDTYGAVSSECVAKMAEGVRLLTGSDYSVATSGIAGPGGGSAEKPVGLVWVGVSSKNETKTFEFCFKHDRKRNIERFAASALNELRILIEAENK